MPAYTRCRWELRCRDAAGPGRLRTAGQNDSTLQRCWIDGWEFDESVDADLERGDTVRRFGCHGHGSRTGIEGH
jgi:hypothetical protein